MRHFIIFFIIIFGFVSNLQAFEQTLSNEYKESQARQIFRSLKCAVCEGQSVGDSEAPFAKSVRLIVREKLQKGFNQEEIYDILKDRYGEEIMFKPPFQSSTMVLWLLPFFMVFAGFIVVVFALKRGKQEPIQFM